ncbi:hypothetical protein TEH_23250 [Tetragenococcus halophilus NBRC 12172]|uniref:Uncharacterized protein n=1 Tax=Tetragenococcus halophilus (strain DSM 20338 / JCM 20259 / NCIMB 9735 / NBRC 12172) TaxID=945021 RepID=A0AAN1SIX2_TETHN|nr:hypothetical protein AC806_06280 [Tetragenococcus halophilus]RQD29669.1 hypothetical protein C7K42_12530 [Tetragenococcus halophilus subsp. halophilus DSM 20339]BAK95652.1 hypothetical protein TEH_23250 [Tetragenococcus halophilus NBRC 12172]GMA45083.1 hypothetical protein GCM10025853_25400 [Tetragenococcus halophilus subsp. halophilus DSM 20339]
MESYHTLPEEVCLAIEIVVTTNRQKSAKVIVVSYGYEGLNNNNFEVNKEVDVLTRTAANTVVKTDR